MANDNNHQNIRVKGNGNIIGNNNTVNNRREELHYHHGGSSKGGSGSDDAVGVGVGILFVVWAICWIFVRHAPEIYFYIKLGALVSAIPLLIGVVIFAFSRKAPDKRQIAATIFGFALSATTFFLAQYGQDRLDPQLLQFGQQARDALAFWKGLTEYDRNVVVENLIGVIGLGATVFFSFLMGIFVLWRFVYGTDIEDSFILRILNPFRPSRGGIFACLCILIAWAFESGFVF
ncbi:MAG: hypothetical protein LBS40_08660 [Burkholderiales bacterium]|jgi:hypothetical protein|nr:hypothetical protein [Burkholderiales bacterium]